MSKMLTVAQAAERLGTTEKALRTRIYMDKHAPLPGGRRRAPESRLVHGRRLFMEENVERQIIADYEAGDSPDLDAARVDTSRRYKAERKAEALT